MKITEFKETYKDSFPVGEGWRPLVEQLVDDIIEIDPTIEVVQVKEKYGELRFYTDKYVEPIERLIEQAVYDSTRICESCGSENNVTTEGGWLLTLCEKCREKKEDR